MQIAGNSALSYQYLVMLLPLSEPVPLLPGVAAKVEYVCQSAQTPVPERFLHFHGPAELVLIKEGAGQLICEGSCHSFAAVQTFNISHDGQTAAPSGLSKFRPLLDQLDRDPTQTLRLAEAATLCAMSPSYFSRRFKQTFSAGFIEYQSRLKLQQAARILVTSDEPISQIGYRMGFRSHAYFSHCFRAEFGVSPSKLRSKGLTRANVR